MSQKTEILELLKQKTMTQGQLSIAIYGDNKHMSNIYASLTSLVNSGEVIRTGEHPAYYSLTGVEITIPEKPVKNKEYIELEITNESIEAVDDEVEKTDNYGRENALITACFKKYPSNTDIETVAMKIGLIDITNSTNISRYKRKISVVELAEIIASIPNIDERIKNGDPEVVSAIAKANGKINLFSFASKYCCYHNKNLYGKDDYSILDTVLKNSLPSLFNDIKKSDIKRWVDSYDYKSYNEYINRKLDEYGIDVPFRKRKFDHFVWFKNR